VDATVTIGEHTITPPKKVKYLGVVFNKEMRYKQYIQNVIKRGTSAVLTLARILKSMWGAPYEYRRQLFTAVVAPRMDYAVIVWHRPIPYNNNPPATGN
jgi:hypothetical protein